MKGRFKFRDDYIYKMPVHFGGHPFVPSRVVYGDVRTIAVSYKTDLNMLSQYVPDVFEIIEPVINLSYANCQDVDWMGGGEYNLIQVTVPVKYLGNDEGLTGNYALVVWEDKATPIIGGREEDGVPKLFASIARHRYQGDHYFTNAGYEGNCFLKLDFFRKDSLDVKTLDQLNEGGRVLNLFGWRYLPNLGKGGASLSHATLYPQSATFESGFTGSAKITWNVPLPEEHPTQYYIVAALEALPIISYENVLMTKGTTQLNVGDSKILP